MLISTLNEHPNDTRVAITPTAVKHYRKMGFDVACEHLAGLASGFHDADYEEAGATIITDRPTLLKKTKVLVLVNEPLVKNIETLPAKALLVSHVEQDEKSPLLTWGCRQGISIFSMNLIPRLSRAQSMDSLSSQANLAGYRAVLEAISHFKRAIPMMMTAAGMIQPAKVLVLGAGVAGLQAIATAKRLGAIVYAFDVRRAAKEQVESLGAEFIEVHTDDKAETAGGYAREMGEDYKHLQGELIHHFATQADIVIATALIPGKKAPILLTQKTIEKMKPGSVVVDLATARGGNCEVSKKDKVIQHGEVTVVGYSNLAGLIPTTASELYANNLVNLIRLLAPNPNELSFNETDEIIKQAMLCHDGNIPPFQSKRES